MSKAKASGGQRATDPFRLEHRDIADLLADFENQIGKLPEADREERKQTMTRVIAFLRGHVLPHAAWEERVLYPAVDRRAGSGENRFTATMRHEHAIVARWTDELAREAFRAEPDAVWFARRADRLLGLLQAHVENEEEVLLPVLDWTMTAEEFENEILSKGLSPDG